VEAEKDAGGGLAGAVVGPPELCSNSFARRYAMAERPSTASPSPPLGQFLGSTSTPLFGRGRGAGVRGRRGKSRKLQPGINAGPKTACGGKRPSTGVPSPEDVLRFSVCCLSSVGDAPVISRRALPTAGHCRREQRLAIPLSPSLLPGRPEREGAR